MTMQDTAELTIRESALAIFLCAVVAMAVGALWYGPLFGKKWMEVTGANPGNTETRKKMQKGAAPLYLIQFLLTIPQAGMLAIIIGFWKDISGIEVAFWTWFSFAVPIIAGTAMWNNDSRRVAWTRFLIQAGYQLVIFVLFGLIINMWR